MRNIMKFKEAVAIPIIAVLIIVIVVVAGIAVMMNPEVTGSNPYWETETDFGMWQDELIIEFEDGTTKSMKIISESTPLTIYYGGSAITSVSIKLTAKATGSGYTGAEVKLSSFGYTSYIKSWGNILYTGSSSSSATHTISMGATKTMLQAGMNLKATVDDDPTKFPDGTYTVEFVPKGTAQYRGLPDDDSWKTASLPPTRSIEIRVERAPTGSILVTLYSETIT